MTVAWGTSVACTGATADASAAWIASTVPMRAMVAGRMDGAGVIAAGEIGVVFADCRALSLRMPHAQNTRQARQAKSMEKMTISEQERQSGVVGVVVG